MILKVCGITNSDDAAAAVEAGATALGFNFYSKSPRYIAPESAATILSAPGVRRVGIFVNESPARVEEIVRIAALDVAQLHGDETSAAYPAAVPVWKAVRVGSDFMKTSEALGYAGGGEQRALGEEARFGRLFEKYDLLPVEALLLDGPASGVTFDWHVAATVVRIRRPYRLILAGGLDASNVAAAVAQVHPWGVDVCSRIESAPGRKDHKKMTEFLQAAKAALAA